jgi:ATP-dependent Clp protease protease subunit
MEQLFKIMEDDDIYSTIIKEHLNDRKLIINQDIDDDLLEQICLMILKWNMEDTDIPADKRKKIYIYLNSLGGDVIMGAQIVSSILSSITPIVTVGFSKCASMAFYILAAGHERYCFEHTVALHHDGESGYFTSSNKGKDIQKFHDRMDDRLNDFLTEHTNMTQEFLDSIKDREYYMFADEAKEKGVIDKIIGVDCTIEEIL